MFFDIHIPNKFKQYFLSLLLMLGFATGAAAQSFANITFSTQDAILPASSLLWSSDAEGAAESDLLSGEFEVQKGSDGVRFHLPMPDGRLDLAALEFGALSKGTIEWRVLPCPSIRLWRNAGWHYFLHLRPEHADGLQLDLWRHPRTNFRLTASKGMGPFKALNYPPERVAINTDSLNENDWQHMMVSWDLSANPQQIALLVNGSGRVMRLPENTYRHTRFIAMEFGNRPSTWEVPYLAMDGAIKKIRIYNTTIIDR